MLRLLNNTRFIWLPIPLMLAAMAALWAADLHTAYESPILLLSLNFLCTTLTSALVVVLVGKSFIRSGAPGLLMLGCGVLSWGLAATFVSAVLGHGINATVTVHNILVWLAALCHLSGVALSLKRFSKLRMPPLVLALAYTGMLGVAWLADVLTMEGLTPLFFIQGHGGTPIRQFVLGSAIVMFGISAAMLWWTNRSPPSPFVRWYTGALLLVAIGLLGVMVQTVFGGALSWTGRTAQYLGGIYMLAAAFASVRESGMDGLSLSAALREAQQNYRTLVDMSPDAIAVYVDGKYVFVNPAAVHLFGANAPEDLVGREVLSLVPPEDREAVAARMRRSMENGRTALIRQFHVLRLDGQPVDVETAGARIEFQGRTAVQLVLRDISEIKRTEQALRESEALYRSIGESIDYGVWVCMPDGRNVYASESFLKMVSITQEQCSNFGWGNVLHPDDAELTIAAWQECVRTGGTWDIEHRFHGADGQWHHVLARGVPVKNEQDEIINWAGINLDISRLKHAEEQLKASLAEKELLTKEIHHRVKNNLQIISSLISLQADSLADAQLQGVLGDVRDRVKTMALVHEKLYQTEDLALLDFAEYASSLLNYLWSAHGAATGKVRLNMSFAPLILPIEMAVHCGLILNELGSNAIKHAFPGGSGGEVAVTLEHDPATGAVCLRVRDNGIGLPEDLDWRQSSSLGLRLVQMLARQMRGTVQTGTCPDPGPGTEFQIRFNIKGIPA